MNIMIWMMRAKRWAQNPPSAKMVVFILSLIMVMIALAAFETYVGLPDWMAAERMRAPQVTPLE